MQPHDVPVNPFRTQLYSPADLLGAFDPDDAMSYRNTVDFVAYRSYVQHAKDLPYMHSIVHALHDNSITQAIGRFVEDRRVVGIMGGHRLRRDSPAYRQVAVLARMLSKDGYTLASGGGPGAMEATHLGAHLAGSDDRALDEAIGHLALAPQLPDGLDAIVDAHGEISGATVEHLHAWQRPAFDVARQQLSGAESLAIPTWHYGHEPPTPLASHIAKYFQNSIREDGLLALAKSGIIFTEGRAGTIQEIFQDAAQNYYRSHDWFSPMVLLGVDYWTNQLPVVEVLRALFDPKDRARSLTVTDDLGEALEAIREFVPRPV